MTKITWPIRPSNDPGSSEGFIRDDQNGTVYAGEGGWGAPLRDCNDIKPWTRNSGSFNQFSWIFVDENQMEIRTVRIADSDVVMEVDSDNIFRAPTGLSTWNPSNGDVVIVRKPGEQLLAAKEDVPPVNNQMDMFAPDQVVASRVPGFAMQDFLTSTSDDGLEIIFSTANEPVIWPFTSSGLSTGGSPILRSPHFPETENR